MKWITRTALAIAAGAALSLSAPSSSSAAPISQPAGAVQDAVQQTNNITDVRHRRRGYYGRHYGYRYGYRRHRHRHRGVPWWLFAGPLLHDGYYYRPRHRYYRHRYYRDRYYPYY